MIEPNEFIYKTPLWRVRRLDGGWYQGESPLFAAPTGRTIDFQEARKMIECRVEIFLKDNGYIKDDAQLR